MNNTNPNSEIKKDLTYYSRDRHWPSFFKINVNSNILDIGCGQGILGLYLKNKYMAHVTGLEIIEDNFKIAQSVLDQAILADIEKFDFSEIKKKYDYIIFSDSLEHFLNPDLVLEKIKTLLNTNGELLIAMPNVRNFRVIIPLLFCDQWTYTDEGLLDRTHLRFFTESSLKKLLCEKGFTVKAINYDLPLNSKVGFLNLLTFGLFKRILTSHIYLNACLKKS